MATTDLPFDPRKLIPDPDWQAPDVVGTVPGWRAWAIPRKPPPFGVPPKLYSVSEPDYFWAPRKRAVAECPRNGCRPEQIPNPECMCGFYSAKTLEHLLSMKYHVYDLDRQNFFKAVGQVACWGKVIEGSQGWISRYAYPVELWVPYGAWRLAKPLATAYGVKVQIKNFLSDND